MLGDDLPTFAVKDGIDMFTANCLHPEVSQKGIREGVAAALQDVGKRKSTRWNHRSSSASSSTRRPSRRPVSTSRRSPADPYTTEFTTDDMPKAMKIIFAELLLALQVGQKGIYS